MVGTMISASVVGLLASLAPQAQQDPRLETRLNSRQLARLRTTAQSWLQSEVRARTLPRYRERRDDRRRRFVTQLKKYGGKHDLLASTGDLLNIFSDAIPRRFAPATGEWQNRDQPDYAVRAPSGYTTIHAAPAVVVLRTPGGPRQIDLARTWYGTKTWDTSIFILPRSSNLFARNENPDLSLATERRTELERVEVVMSALAATREEYRLDPRRVFLDCHPGTTAFGLRLASYFPDRFAGIILRDPSPIGARDHLRNLYGADVLLVCVTGSRECEEFERSLRRVQTHLKQVDTYDTGSPVDAWLQTTTRPLFPTTVVLSPSDPEFRRSHWLEIRGELQPPSRQSGPRPDVTVQIDRTANRLTVTAVGVSEIGLLLNDYLVDFDTEPELFVNGRRVGKLKLERSLATLEKTLLATGDPTALYTAYQRVIISSIVPGSHRITALPTAQRRTTATSIPEFIPNSGRRRGNSSPAAMRHPTRRDRPPRPTAPEISVRKDEFSAEESATTTVDTATPTTPATVIPISPLANPEGRNPLAYHFNLPDVVPWIGYACVLALVFLFWLARRSRTS